MQYMTPAFLRRLNTGIDLSGVTDEQIARLLALATSFVNRETAAPNHPAPHDFRGGSAIAEQHVWDLGNNYRTGSDRLYLYHLPVKAVANFTLRVTSNQSVVFEPADIYVNRNDGYIEIISLARRLSVFSAGFVPVIGLRQPVAELTYTYGWSYPVTGEPVFADETLRVFSAANQWWDPAVPVRAYVNGVEADPSTYTVDHRDGQVTFDAQVYDGAGVTLDYTYCLPSEIRDAMTLLFANVSEAARMVGGGLTSVRQVKVEEAMIAFSDRKSTVLENAVDARIAALLSPYRFRSW